MSTLKLYLISQDKNRGYDTYDSAVVAAESEEVARSMHPDGGVGVWRGDWCAKDFVTVQYIGEAKEGTECGVLCASFNAG